MALHRLVKAGTIRRIRRGLYDLPGAHPIIGQTGPNIMAITRALLEGSHVKWQFTEAYTANAPGMSEQVPARVVGWRVRQSRLFIVFTKMPMFTSA